MERVQTGIPGLDDLLKGGIPRGSSVLLAGGTGTGKTILATQYIYKGAEKYNEPGIFVSLETNIQNIIWNMQSFQWNIKKMQDSNLMRTYRLNLGSPDNPDAVWEKMKEELDIIAKMVEELGAKRLAIDSLAAFGVWIEKRGKIRNMIYSFTNQLKEIGCTTLMTTETKGGKNDFSAFGVEEFVSDGVVALYFTPPNRSIFIKKMRGTMHSRNVHPLDIGPEGILIKSKDNVMWESIK